jgi:hypothetical protein
MQHGYRSMAAAASSEEPMLTAQVPPLMLRGLLPLTPTPWKRKLGKRTPPLPSVTSTRLAMLSRARRNAQRSKKRPIFQYHNFYSFLLRECSISFCCLQLGVEAG